MSWMKENYEKAALGGAALLLVGIGVKCFVLGGDEVSSAAKPAPVNDDVENAMLGTLTKVLEDRAKPAVVRDKIIDGRAVDLSIGQPLYMKAGSTKPVDLYSSAPVHTGMDNKWWIINGIDPGFANAPERDFDKDGFTNREEYDAKTDPKSADSANVTAPYAKAYPSLLNKLVADEVTVHRMQMRWSVIDQNNITLTYQDSDRLTFRENVALGGVFFDRQGTAIHQRFKLGGEKIKVPDPRSGQDQDAYEVTDMTPRYKNTPREKFVIPRRGTENRGFTEIQDRSAKLTLHALGKSGEPFVVFEYQTFTLPFDANAKEPEYKVTSIVPKQEGGTVYEVTIIDLKNPDAQPRVLAARKN